MTYKEEKKDLFLVDFSIWTPAHCISRDCKMGAGIAVPMKQYFFLDELKKHIDEYTYIKLPPIGFSFYYNDVYNLITKKNYWDKPTLDSVWDALMDMFVHARKNNINKIVMPKIGSGLDKLLWDDVRIMIIDLLVETDIEIMVCSL